MAIYKNKDIETNINERGAELGNINVNFYTEDNGTASIRIKMNKQDGTSIDFNKTDMLPRLDLFSKDGSIFTKEPLEIILPEQGLIQYKVTEYVIKHKGKMDCKLFLVNGNKSVHVANFYFVINDSGLTGSVGRELRVEVLEDYVYKVLSEHADKFKGEKGDVMKFNDLTEDEKEEIRGYKGDKGDTTLVPPKIYTRDEYNQLATKDNNTLYFISEV